MAKWHKGYGIGDIVRLHDADIMLIDDLNYEKKTYIGMLLYNAQLGENGMWPISNMPKFYDIKKGWISHKLDATQINIAILLGQIDSNLFQR